MEQEKTGTVAYFCPTCGSAAVQYSALEGGTAECGCGWKGRRADLLAHVFTHQHGSDTSVAIAFTNDVRAAYGKAAKPFAEVMLKWGFFDGRDTRTLSRYLAAMALASMQALLRTRQAIEKERAHGH